MRTHRNARTSPAARQEIARSTEPVRMLAARYGVSTETIRKWQRRGEADCQDRSTRPHRLSAKTSPAQRDAIRALQCRLNFPLDDLAGLLVGVLPTINRHSLWRILRSEDLSRRVHRRVLPVDMRADDPPASGAGFVRIDVVEMPELEALAPGHGMSWLFVATDRRARLLRCSLTRDSGEGSAIAFLRELAAASATPIRHVRTGPAACFTTGFIGACLALGLKPAAREPPAPFVPDPALRMDTGRSGFATPAETFEQLHRQNCVCHGDDGLPLPGEAGAWPEDLPRRWPEFPRARQAVGRVATGLSPAVPTWLANGVAIAICAMTPRYRMQPILQAPPGGRRHLPALERLATLLGKLHAAALHLEERETRRLECIVPPHSGSSGVMRFLVLPGDGRGLLCTLPEALRDREHDIARLRIRETPGGQASGGLARLHRALFRSGQHLGRLSGRDFIALGMALSREMGEEGSPVGLPDPATALTLSGEAARSLLLERLEVLRRAALAASTGSPGRPQVMRGSLMLIEQAACLWSALTGRPPDASGKRGSLHAFVADIAEIILNPVEAGGGENRLPGDLGPVIRTAVRAFAKHPGYIPTQGFETRRRPRGRPASVRPGA
ncbi:hypothetical protein [Roseomonas gilardii]|uniref:hypothetical protein n=1 Tax=Roseomonas gilardii TaxID=257708 RepID=UPI001C92E9E3|nr:hypothetical protein [Roseomonas gilardii]